MSKWTIMRPDHSVYCDGVPYNVDLSSVPADVRIIQWDDARNKGWIEYYDDVNGNHRLNENITELPNYMPALTAQWPILDSAQQALVTLNQAQQERFTQINALQAKTDLTDIEQETLTSLISDAITVDAEMRQIVTIRSQVIEDIKTGGKIIAP